MLSNRATHHILHAICSVCLKKFKMEMNNNKHGNSIEMILIKNLKIQRQPLRKYLRRSWSQKFLDIFQINIFGGPKANILQDKAFRKCTTFKSPLNDIKTSWIEESWKRDTAPHVWNVLKCLRTSILWYIVIGSFRILTKVYLSFQYQTFRGSF